MSKNNTRKLRARRGRPRLPRGRRRCLEEAPGRARAARRALGAVPEHPRGHPGTRGLGAPRGPVGGVRVNRVLPPGHGAGAGGAASAVADEPEPREALREGDRRRRQDGQGGRPGAGQARPGAAGGPAPRAAARARDIGDGRPARGAGRADAGRSTAEGQMEHARNPLVCRQLKARLAMVKRHTQAVDRELNRLVARDAELSHRVELLKTMPGVADVTSVGLAVDVPELGTLSVRTAGASPGSRPWPTTRAAAAASGASRAGAPACARCCTCPRRHERRPEKPRHARAAQLLHGTRRKARGMVPMVSLTAEVRKLIVMANAIIRDDTPWSLDHVPKAPAA